MDPATIMMIMQTMAKVAEASKPQPHQLEGPSGVMPPPPNTAAQLMSARAQNQPGPERTKLQSVVDNVMKNPGVTPQLEQNLAKQQKQKPTLEEVEERTKDEGPGTLDKVAMGAEIGNTVRGMMPKPPSPGSMRNFGAAARSGPEPTSTRFRRDRASKLNDYVRALLRRR